MLPKRRPLFPGTHFLFTILLFCSFSSSYQQGCNPQDQSSLLAFSTNLSTSSSPLNWSSAITCCHWEGVACDTKGRVTHLWLPSRGLKGVITSSIENLLSLTHLNLSNNNFHGPLREGIAGLVNLRIMDISSNRIFGRIPQEIGNLLYLEKLYLHNNNLIGPIPSSLMNCTNLTDIVLRENHLDGDISKLDLSRLLHLQKLDLMDNKLSGSFPESIYSCKSLIAIRVSENNLTGQISPKIVNLKSLSFLSLTNNSFSNIKITLRILAKCKNLTTLLVGLNFNGESLPYNRNFLGPIGFPKLELISLFHCNLTGFFPEWVSNLKTLRILDLNKNNITGKIPDWVGTLPNLFSLQLRGNLLFGEIPPRLCQLPAMVSETLDPKLHLFHFELPVFLVMTGGNDQFVMYPSTLVLADNKLSGHIPSNIGKLQNLQHLLLGNNHFSGNIPVSLSNLKNLEQLDLSENNLTGGIPESLESLHFLSNLDLSYNDLQGPIPTGGQFAAFDESVFEGNPGLCGEILHRRCSSTATPKAKDHPLEGGSESKQLFFNGLRFGFASGFASVLVIAAPYIWFKICTQGSPSPRRA